MNGLGMRAVLCAALALVAAPAAASAQTGLPADNAVAGWKKADPQKTFTEADLYGHIDGGAELFLEFGFEQLAVQKYRNGTGEVTVESYRMTDPVAAAGIYLLKCGKETPDPSFKDRHTVNRYQLMLLRNRYFVIVNNQAGQQALRPALVAFAGAIAATLPPAVTIAEMATLPRTGLAPGSIRLIRGPYALQAVFTLGDGDILQLRRTVTAVAGNYAGAAGSYTLIQADYPSPAAASKTLGYLQANLDRYLRVVSKTQAGFVFQDYAKKFGAVRLSGRRLEIRVRLDKPPQ